MRVAAYVYPGWHPTPERDAAFHPGFTEWELVAGCGPRFEGHRQPRRPLLGTYDDRDPNEVARRIGLALDHGVDAFVYGFFWCRGKRIFGEALDRGYLGSALGRRTPFAVMWANRMPRRVLPIRRPEAPVIEDERRVPSDVVDFVDLVTTLGRQYFRRDNYLRVAGGSYFSIYDSTFFLRELGLDAAREAIQRAREALRRLGLGELHLAAIEPSDEVRPAVRSVGFDSVTNYVLLPEWKGPFEQDYGTLARQREGEWAALSYGAELPYMPSVAPGWDASPRGADFGATRPDRYPWSPVVTGESPAEFRRHLRRALDFHSPVPIEDPLVFIASLNEWSEGHYLEPDDRVGYGWLEAVRAAREDSRSPRPIEPTRSNVLED